MASPTVTTRTATHVSSDSFLHAVNLGGPSAGDLIVVVSSFDGAAGLVQPWLDTEFSGKNWNVSALINVGNGNPGMALVAWKVAEGGDALRYQMILGSTPAAEQSAHLAYIITGHGGAVFLGSTSVLSGTNGDPPNVAITGAAQDILALAALCTDANTVPSAAPAGYGTLTTQAGNAFFGASVAVAELGILAVSSENPGAFTNAAVSYAAITILVTSTAITTNARTTQEAVESASDATANLVVTQEVVEVASSFVNNMVVTQLVTEMVSTNVPDDVANDAAIVGAFI